MRSYLVGVTALALLLVAPVGSKPPLPNWDGLNLVPAHRMDLLYLRPGADFSGYRKIMLDPPQIAYDKEWRRNYNRSATSRLERLTDEEIRGMIDDGTQMLTEAYGREFRKAGYEIVSAPGADVMRLFVGLGNVQIVAPEPLTPGVRTFSEETGRATLVLEARDSLSGTLLGRAVDQQIIDDFMPMMRSDSGNRADFESQFRQWARISAIGLTDLRAARRPR